MLVGYKYFNIKFDPKKDPSRNDLYTGENVYHGIKFYMK